VIVFFFLSFSFSFADEAANLEIQRVITSQLSAFLNDDAEAAWFHAHPSIKSQFGNPTTFMAMVKGGYEPMTRFVQLDFLSLESVDDMWVQTIRMIDDTGNRFELLYVLVESENAGFQIAGVSMEANNGI
jgi:hypothetical protein